MIMYLSLVETAEDQSRFQQIYYTYRKQMFFVANGILDDKFLAEDAVQEAFLGIAKQITLFRDMPECRVKAYALTAVKNAALNLSRQEQKFEQLRLGHEAVADDPHQDQMLEGQLYQETHQTLISLITALPDFQRDILLLRYSHEMTCAQIGIALGRKASTVRKELSRARRALRKHCKKEGIEIED